MRLGSRSLRNQSGMLLVSVLVWVAIMAMLLLSLMTLVREQSLMVRWQQQDDQLLMLAEQGVRCAEYDLNQQPLAWCAPQPELSVTLVSHQRRKDARLITVIHSVASRGAHQVQLVVNEMYVGHHWRHVSWSQREHGS